MFGVGKKIYPIPYRINYTKCKICPPPVPSTNNVGVPMTGNINILGSFNNINQRYATTIKVGFANNYGSSRANFCNSRPKTIYIKKKLNAFQSYEGAPGGFGSPPRTSF